GPRPTALPTRRSSDRAAAAATVPPTRSTAEGRIAWTSASRASRAAAAPPSDRARRRVTREPRGPVYSHDSPSAAGPPRRVSTPRSEEHTSELQSRENL